jgi:hypothetical protein
MKALTEFENLVYEMRKNQKAFFKTKGQKTKNRQYLIASKQLEVKVDEHLSNKITEAEQPKLDL